MLCVARGVTSISIDGIEYEVRDALVKIPDADYKKIINHQGIRAATSAEIASLERVLADKKVADDVQRKAAEAAARLEAEEKAKKEAAEAKKAAEKAAQIAKTEEGAANVGK